MSDKDKRVTIREVENGYLVYADEHDGLWTFTNLHQAIEHAAEEFDHWQNDVGRFINKRED